MFMVRPTQITCEDGGKVSFEGTRYMNAVQSAFGPVKRCRGVMSRVTKGVTMWYIPLVTICEVVDLTPCITETQCLQ